MQSTLADVDAHGGVCMCVQGQDQLSKSTLERVTQSSSPTHVSLSFFLFLSLLPHLTGVSLLPVQEELKGSQQWEAGASSCLSKGKPFNLLRLISTRSIGATQRLLPSMYRVFSSQSCHDSQAHVKKIKRS